MQPPTLRHVVAMLERHAGAEARAFLERAVRELEGRAGDERFCQLVSLASRYAPRKPLAPDAAEVARAGELLAGWNPERWTCLEAMRVALVLSHPDLERPSFEKALEEAFRYADMGELCALYESLAHLPQPERFVWRAGEGARSSMKSVFEATCCDTPYPVRWFDDVAWRQAVIKALFVEAPLWRVWGLDTRLDAEVARMALDLADERRSAGRPVNPETWLCLGASSGERGLASLERELASGPPRGRAAAAIALARAGGRDRLLSLAALEKDPLVHRAMSAALEGKTDARAFAALDPTRAGAR